MFEDRCDAYFAALRSLDEYLRGARQYRIESMNYRTKLRAVLLVDHGVNLLDVTGPLQTFATFNGLSPQGGQGYETVVVSLRGGLVTTTCGQEIMTAAFSNVRDDPIDTLLILGVGDELAVEARPSVDEQIRGAVLRARRVCALGTGIFLLAATGQVGRHRVAAHRSYAAVLQGHYPSMLVDADRLFVRDGAIWTSVGLAASFDLALALIEEDYGHAMAIKAARHLILFIKRSGLQPQVSVSLAIQSSPDWMFADLHAWIVDHLNEDLSVARLAERMCMTPRTFARKYTERLGKTPAKTVEALRLEAACRALENLANPIKSIAARVGLFNEQTMQRAFRRAFGMTPSEYRAAHQKKNSPCTQGWITHLPSLQRKNGLASSSSHTHYS